jgi:hypothetical protein
VYPGVPVITKSSHFSSPLRIRVHRSRREDSAPSQGGYSNRPPTPHACLSQSHRVGNFLLGSHTDPLGRFFGWTNNKSSPRSLALIDPSFSFSFFADVIYSSVNRSLSRVPPRTCPSLRSCASTALRVMGPLRCSSTSP